MSAPGWVGVPRDSINILAVRKVLGRAEWLPPQPLGRDGWSMVRADGAASVIVSSGVLDGTTWIHASVAGHREQMPSYLDLVLLHAAVFGAGYAYQVFAPPARHVNLHQYALHLWGRADGQPVLPDFAIAGSI